MGPSQNITTPLRPRFSWDIRNVPWTDGQGDQLEYAQAVSSWCDFQDNLHDANPNKIGKNNRGIVLRSQLYGRAKDICKSLDAAKVASDGGVKLIVNAVYKRDALSVVTTLYDELQQIMSLRRASGESFPDFELRFAAQLARFNSLAPSVAIHDSISALMLLANAEVDAAQRISILAATSPNDMTLDENSTMDDFAASVGYETVATVLRQCEKSTAPAISTGSRNLSASFASQQPRSGHRQNRGNRVRLTREQVAEAKKASQCKRCGQYGHWWGDHEENGDLKPGALSSDKPIVTAGGNNGVADAEAANERGKKPKRALHFNTASLSSVEGVLKASAASTKFTKLSEGIIIGPLVDCGAPYSAIGEVELRALAPEIAPDWNRQLDPIPATVADRPYWQYGRDSHASDVRAVLGSITIDVCADDGAVIGIRHLVLDGASQWVLGRNITSRGDVRNIGSSAIVLPGINGATHTITTVDYDLHSYVPKKAFSPVPDEDCATLVANAVTTRSASTAEALNAAVADEDTDQDIITNRREVDAVKSITRSVNKEPLSNLTDWSKLKPIVDRVHRHVCGHADYGDIRLMLKHNGMWNTDAAKYLSHVVESCRACRAAVKPPASRKVSLSFLSRDFNDVVCVDHLFLDQLRVFHAMDAATRYSTGTVVNSLEISESTLAFEQVWLALFWPPTSVYGDAAFRHDAFTTPLRDAGTKFCPIPPRRHSRNVLESKHGIIRSVFLRLKEHTPDADARCLAQRAIRISNDLYGSDILSAFELARGFSRPLGGSASGDVHNLPPDLLDAQQKLASKRKLARILRSKSVKEPTILVGDLVEVFIKNEKAKRGKWTSPRTVLQVDLDSWTVTVPGEKGRTINAAVEDVRPAIGDESFAASARQANDELDDRVAELLHSTFTTKEEDETEAPHQSDCADTDDTAVGEYGSGEQQIIPAVGDRIEVYWPIDSQYFLGEVVEEIDSTTVRVNYDDGDTEVLKMPDETWRFASSAILRALQANIPRVESNEPRVLDAMLDHFGCKPFLRHAAQGFPGFPLQKAYQHEEQSFVKTVRSIPLGKVPIDANIISSHVLYKVKQNDDGSLKLKARIAPHGNEDAARHELRSDCSMCAPHGVRMLLSVATIKRWRLTKLDVQSAFLQTGAASRDVYVVPPPESVDRGNCLWLLLTAAYGLVNANAKFQAQSDAALKEIGLSPVPLVPQLFYRNTGDQLAILASKIVDDLLLTGDDVIVEEMTMLFNDKFKLGTIVRGPGVLRFYGLNVVQSEDYAISVDGDDKISAIETYPLSRYRRRQGTEALNALEKKSFSSVNSSVGWLGVNASPFCAFFASSMQQLAPRACVKDLVEQHCSLRDIKKHGTLSSFVRPDAGDYSATILVYCDAGRQCDAAQLCFIAGLLLGDVKAGSVYHTLAWASHKSQRPVRSVGAAEILACGEAIAEGKVLARAMSFLLDIDVPLVVIVDSKDLFDSLSTQRNSIDKSIRADVSVIRYELELDRVRRFMWVPGRENLADPGTKANSPLSEALRLLLAIGRLPIEHGTALSRSADSPLG